MRSFFVLKFVQSQILSREKLLKRLLYVKDACKMLMKLTPGKTSFAKRQLRRSRNASNDARLHRRDVRSNHDSALKRFAIFVPFFCHFVTFYHFFD